MSLTKNRLKLIREWMNDNKIDAFIIPHEDEYLSEYIPPESERLFWLTNFTGSAGAAIVLQDKAAIFVDGRYTVQVKNQVDNLFFEYKHITKESYIEWINTNLTKDKNIGYDSRLHRAIWVQNTQKVLSIDLNLVPIAENPIDLFWDDRPIPKSEKAFLLSEEYSGKQSSIKREEIASHLHDNNIDAAFITQLDSIAWLLNIRGTDVPCNPVLLCHAIIYKDASLDLFIDLNKIPDGFLKHVGDGVRIHSPEKLHDISKSLSAKNVLYDMNGSNAYCFQILSKNNVNILNGDDPCVLPKACKNETELKGMKACHIRDAIAECEFLSWLDNQVDQGKMLDEGILSDKLEDFRSNQELYKGLSFGTISAAAGNASMCHYSHLNQDIPGKIEMDSVYLVDSGGQYLDGTTDITRTIAIGNPSNFIKKMFTLVLKGHIALASARFPHGIGGQHLDTLARQYLWYHGYDFDHGTGHGVGCFLNVHEGPQRIGKGSNNVPLLPGMIISNEPGYYQDNEFGIRCENLIFVKKSNKDNLYEFENLTYVPFDIRLIDKSLMTDSEIDWLNDYHNQVFKKISPLVSKNTLKWLEKVTKSI